MLLIIWLKDLKIKGADVMNPFLMVQNKEKCCLVTGPQLEALERNANIVEKALYGLKSTSTSFSLQKF